MNRKRKGWLHVPELSSMVCKARSRAMKSTNMLKSLERLPKGPVTKARYEPHKLSSWTKVDPGCRRSSSSARFLMSVQAFAARARIRRQSQLVGRPVPP